MLFRIFSSMSQKFKVGLGFGSLSPQPKSNLANIVKTINTRKSIRNKDKKVSLERHYNHDESAPWNGIT